MPAQQGIHTGPQPDFPGDAAGTGVPTQPSEPTVPLKIPAQDSVSDLNVSVLLSQARGDRLPLLGTSQGLHQMSEELLFDLHALKMVCLSNRLASITHLHSWLLPSVTKHHFQSKQAGSERLSSISRLGWESIRIRICPITSLQRCHKAQGKKSFDG